MSTGLNMTVRLLVPIQVKITKTGNTQFPSGNMKYENLELSKEKEMTFIKSDSCFCQVIYPSGSIWNHCNMTKHVPPPRPPEIT